MPPVGPACARPGPPKAGGLALTPGHLKEHRKRQAAERLKAGEKIAVSKA